MHRYILGITDSNVVIDHIDRNGLNNQRKNLRVVSGKINSRNKKVSVKNSLNFNGISFEPPDNRHQPKGRFRVHWSTNIPKEGQKRYKTQSKSFSINKLGFNEALRQAVQFRIQKMREFDYIIDERSETIEKAILDPSVDMITLLNIDKSKFAGVE